MRLKDKIKMIWEIIRTTGNPTIFDSRKIYFQAVKVSGYNNKDKAIKEAEGLLERTLREIIPVEHFKYGRVDYSCDTCGDELIVRCKYWPLGRLHERAELMAA
jgi:hypothetical protein